MKELHNIIAPQGVFADVVFSKGVHALREARDKRNLLFISHNILTQIRNRYFLSYLRDVATVYIPSGAFETSSMLRMNLNSIKSLLNLSVCGLETKMPKHVDDTDILIYPSWRSGSYALDYHCPMDIELSWLGYGTLAKLSRMFMPKALSRAKIVLAASSRMLDYASKQSEIKHGYVVPDYPPKSSKKNISQDKARAHLTLESGGDIVLFVGAGRLREIYGIELLLKSWISVSRSMPDAQLYIVGGTEPLDLSDRAIEKLQSVGVHFVGRVAHQEVGLWIAASDLCVSQRTPGFPSALYDIHDSLKMSEYALYEKSIVAAGYSDCPDYISARTTVLSYSECIIRALRGEAPTPYPHVWEENIPVLDEAYDYLFSN